MVLEGSLEQSKVWTLDAPSDAGRPGNCDERPGQEQEQPLGPRYDSALSQGAVYLNQLMSFSAVAAPALMALKQTKTFRDVLEKPLWALVTLGSLPVQVTHRGKGRIHLQLHSPEHF